MSYIVKGAKIPVSCDSCPLMRWNDYGPDGELQYCNILHAICEHEEGKRDADCPLTELPPHGRLIDENDVMKSAEELRKSPWYNDEPYHAIRKDGFEMAIDMAVKDAPTVIEAEEEKE